MRWWFRPKRTVPSPEVIGPNQAANPLFKRPAADHWRSYRQVVIITTAGLLTLILAGLAVYGPWGRITSIEVTGTRVVAPDSVNVATEKYIASYRWLIIPNNKIWLMSGRDLEHHLKQLIERRIAVEQVTVVKQKPDRITIRITEREPVFVWDIERAQATVDRHGVVIEAVTERPSDLPLVKDPLQTDFRIGQQVVSDDVAAAIIAINRQLRSVQLAADYFIIPEATCPLTVNRNANVNAEQDMNGNINGPEPANNVNQAVEVLAVNDDSAGQNINAVTCDLASIRKDSPEIHLKLTDGPLALIDRRQDIYQTITLLKMVLMDPDNRVAEYIDVRFLERVYIK